MAGAGYKLFNTGDVLTAAQVNTYLQEQTVMVFASAAARTTALTGVVAEGMISYLTDTDVVQYYNGTTWTTINTDQTPLTTKGDLFTFSTQDARLAVGSNGETLVADSSATTGLRWQGDYAAGKNKIINGDFNINQRAFTSTTSSSVFMFDRFISSFSGGTVTYTAQTFTPGAAPVAGYESKNFLDVATSGQSAASDFTRLLQKIESVRTFAGQTITFSFWAKAATGTPSIAVELNQNFGSGGSPSSAVNTGTTKQAITTSWARYSFTIAVPSISGKTLGTANDDNLQLAIFTSAGSNFNARTDTLGTQAATISFWGLQIENGSVATAFQTATGTLAGELQACQRYFEVITNDTVSAVFYSTSAAYCIAKYNVPKRGGRTITYPTTLTNGLYEIGTAFRTPTALTTEADGNDQLGFTATGMTGGTIGKPLRGTFGTQITVSSEL